VQDAVAFDLPGASPDAPDRPPEMMRAVSPNAPVEFVLTTLGVMPHEQVPVFVLDQDTLEVTFDATPRR
jgi:hypothetical protein